MASIGTLTTGAGVTTIINQKACDASIVFGDIATTFPLSGVQIDVDGQSVFNVIGQATLLTAYSKWLNLFSGTIIPFILKVATGRILRDCVYRFTNAGVTTPTIYAFSDNDNGIPFTVGTSQINASSSQDFGKFSAVFIGTPANVTTVEVVFTNGKTQTMAIQEVDALFASKRESDASGRLGGVSVIDNTDQSIRQIRINCSAANTILIAKLPDAAFKALTT